MQRSFRDIIDLWDSPDALAVELGVKPEAARKWRQRDKIPAEYWLSIAAADRARKASVSLEEMAALVSSRSGDSLYFCSDDVSAEPAA